MAMEANLLGSGFTFNIVDFSLGDLAAKVAEYMESRDKSKREARENTIDDLRCAMSIVMGLTNRYIDLMQAFSTPEVVSDHQSLGETIEEADDYLKRRDLLPYLETLTGDIIGQANVFVPTGWALRIVHKNLLEFRESLGPGLRTGVGLDALVSRIAKARELRKKPSSAKKLQQFTDKTEEMLIATDVSASDRVYVSIGRAIGKLKP